MATTVQKVKSLAGSSKKTNTGLLISQTETETETSNMANTYVYVMFTYIYGDIYFTCLFPYTGHLSFA